MSGLSSSELVPPSLAAQSWFYQMGLVPAAGPSRRWCKRCRLCAGGWGGPQAAGLFLDLFSAGEQLCPKVCAYSARLAPCPQQSPQVFRASPAPPVPAVALRHTPSLAGTWCEAKPLELGGLLS